jgi:hypothetical protein
VVIAPEWEDLAPVRAALIRSYHLYPILGPETETSIARTMAALVLDSGLREALEAMVERQETTDPTELDVADEFTRMSLGSMALVARALGAGNEPSALRYSRPGLLLLRESLTGTVSDPGTEWAIDVVSGGTVGTSLAVTARYGAALSHSERGALGPEPGAQAAVETLAGARRDGVSFSVIDSPSEAESLPWPEGARARLAEQLEGGFVALVPELSSGAEEVAWWRIDPSDGIPIATAASGEGQAAIEGTMVLREISIPQVERTLAYVACLNASVLGGASLNQAGGQCLCRYLGGQVAGAVSGAVSSQAVGSVAQVAGLGPKVAFMLGAGAGYLQNAAGLTPGRPVNAVCQAMMP